MAEPLTLSPAPDGTDLEPAHIGARMLGLPLFEQGENVARVILARDPLGFPLYPTVGVLMPRRSTKTTSIWATVLGLCATIPGYRVVTTAQDGTRAGLKFREIMRTLEANGYTENGTLVTRWSNGRERIEYANGSVVWVVPPFATAFRSEAADLMLFDEAGELDAAKAADLLAGALPLMDTRPMGQAIIAGTPAEGRAGLLWDTLHDDDETVGKVIYAIRDDEEAVIENEDGTLTIVDDVLARVHPGIGTLTTLAKIRSRLKAMGRVMFEREYLCRFPFDAATLALSSTSWGASAVPYDDKPERYAVGFSVNPAGTCASLVAAWRDDEGTGHVAMIRNAAGFEWVSDLAAKEARKGRGHVGYDTIGSNMPVKEQIERLRPVPPLQGKAYRQMIGAQQQLASDLHNGRLRHYDQPAMTAAAEAATWRESEQGRLFRWSPTVDMTPIVGAAIALHTYDTMPVQRRVGTISAAV